MTLRHRTIARDGLKLLVLIGVLNFGGTLLVQNCYFKIRPAGSALGAAVTAFLPGSSVQSGITNLTGHTTQAPAAAALTKVYVVPNPLIVTNGIRGGSSNNGEFTDRIAFYGLTKKCTIRIFS